MRQIFGRVLIIPIALVWTLADYIHGSIEGDIVFWIFIFAQWFAIGLIIAYLVRLIRLRCSR